MQEIGRRPGHLDELVSAYPEDKSAHEGDELFRFNIVILRSVKLEADALARVQSNEQALTPPQRDALIQRWLAALGDASPMLRTEAISGLGFTHDPQYEQAAAALNNDPDGLVRILAGTTAMSLTARARRRNESPVAPSQ